MVSSGEGEPPRLTVAVDDLGAGLWNSKLEQELEARLPLRNVPFSLSRAVVTVEELPIRYLDARSDAQLQRLRQLAHSPVAWFRSPLVHIVLACCPEYEDYKRDLRLRLKAMADTESAAPGQPELLFVYIRPAGADAAAKGPARVFDAMRRDLNRRRERCVRLDPPLPGATGDAGLDDFDRQLKDALRAGFEARAAAYAEEVRRLMLSRLDPSWSFSTLFLVKDGLAAMLEAAGLLEDALKEYSELEAAYLEVLRSGQQTRQPFGGRAAGEDEAAALWASWAATRQAASQPELPPEWVMRQALFASQARLLLKLHRHAEVADRGLAFVSSFGGLLTQQQRAGALPALLREAWSFASAMSLAVETSRLQAARAEEKRRADTLGRGAGRRARLSEAAMQQPGSPSGGPDALPVPIPLSPSAVGITSLQVKVATSSDGDAGGSPSWQQESPRTRMDWQLGTLPGWAAAAAAAEGPAGRPGREGPTGGSASLYCLLGKLYCAARAELLRLGAAAGLDLPKAAAAVPGMSEPRQHVLPPPAAAAGAAAPAALPVEAAAQQAAAAAAAAEAAGPAGRQAEDDLPEAPSATDLSQVDLGGPATSSSDQELPGGVSPAHSADQAVATLKLVSAAEGQADTAAEAAAAAASGAGPPAASPRQVAPAPLQRLSVRPRAGDADSSSSSPRSASTHQSSLQHALSDVQSPDAGHAVAPLAALPTTPTAEQNDMRTAERQVASSLAERTSGRGSRLGMAAAQATPTAPAAMDAAGVPELLPWLVHWRLRAALSSQQLFTELFIELSEAAARCYSQCGYLRNAALLRADVADALAKAGAVRRAAALYERQCRTFLREGWHALAAATLPKLAACQQAIDSPGLAHTAAAMLSLPPPFQGTAAERQAACRLLLQAAEQAREGLGSSLPLLPGRPAASDGGIDLSAIVAAAPPKCDVSRFFGRTGPDGWPHLVPTPREPGSGGSGHCGARRSAVGDALPLQLVVQNQLPEALRLSDVVLTLAVLQEMTVIHSPRASPRPLTPPGMHSGQRRSSAPGTPLGDGAAQGLEAQEGAGRERYEAYWQQVEELTCSLVAISSGGGDAGGGSRGSCHDTTLQPLAGEVLLPPGTSLLTFLAAPVQRGLYKALHLRALLQQLPVHVDVQPPEPLWQQQEAAAVVAAAAAHSRGAMSPQALRRSSRAGVPRGGPLAPVAGGAPLAQHQPHHPGDAPAGMHDAETILLDVEQAQPRVQLSLVAAGGRLIAGQEQWLGLALAPERDALRHARLELTWPLAGAAGALPGLSAHPRMAAGAGGMHRAAHSLGGDVRLSPAASSAALSAAAPPFLRPEHRCAVLQAPNGSSAGGDGPQVLSAEGPAGPAAAWLLTEGLQQQLELPTVDEGQPVCLWWRVTAGEVSAPPEQVHIAPPAPRHSSRPLDVRRLAGLPGEGPFPPAAALDLPAVLEYASGCQRSHCRVLAAPVRQPFSVASAARELPSGGVAVQFTLTSNLAVPAQLARLALQPQPGFALSSSLLDGMGLLPAALAPGASLSAAFLLVPEGDAGSSGAGDAGLALPAKLQPSVLSVDYTIDSRQQCGVAAAPLGQQPSGASHSNQQQHSRETGGGGAVAAPASRQQHARGDGQHQQTPGAEALDLLARSASRGASRTLDLLGSGGSAAATPEDGGGEGTAGGRQLCSFRHLLTLELPASEEGSSGTVVFVRLLGPFSATVGQPTTLCWRLERGGQPDQQLPASRISFDVQAESEHWRPLGWRQGGVTLAGHPGAVATVEATWVPLAAGTLPVPELRLGDVEYQEVFDVGLSGGGAIAVADAG